MNPSAVQAAYVRALAKTQGPGESVTLRRGVPPSNTDYPGIRAWVTEFIPEDLEGAVEQGRRNAVLLASSVVASGFPLPFLPKQDFLIWGGYIDAITSIDDATRRIQGVLIAYDVELEGA